MGEEATTEEPEDEELLDGLPEGDDGWEYIEEAATRADSEDKNTSGEGDEGEQNGGTDDGGQEYVGEETTTTDGTQDRDISEETEEEQNGGTGGGGREYVEEETAATEGAQDKDISEETEEEQNGGIDDDEWEYVGEETTTTDGTRESGPSETEQEGNGEQHDSTLRELERAVEESSGREIEKKIASADLELGKGDVTGFVRKTDLDMTRNSFAPGKEWGGDGDGFSELGWVEDGELTAIGASVLAYAGDVVDEAGDEAALVGYLNSVGVDVFLKEALRRGPDKVDEGDGGDGFLGGLLG